MSIPRVEKVCILGDETSPIGRTFLYDVSTPKTLYTIINFGTKFYKDHLWICDSIYISIGKDFLDLDTLEYYEDTLSAWDLDVLLKGYIPRGLTDEDLLKILKF